MAASNARPGRLKPSWERRVPLLLTVALCIACFALGIFLGANNTQLTGSLQPGGMRQRPTQQQHNQKASNKLTTPYGSPICDNSCSAAHNGRCDDGSYALKGGPAALAHVLCDLGTDCDDCGPWKGPAATGDWNGSRGPAEMLQKAGIQLHVRRVARGRASFMMPYTDPVRDVDVSSQMHHNGILEGGISWVFYTALKDRCKNGAAKPPLVVDVGANFGWFTLLSASLGCRVAAWEPVPTFRAFLQYGIQLNDFAHLVTVRTSVLAAEAGQEMTVVVPNRGIWGTAGIAGLNIDPAISNDGPLQEVRVKSQTLDEEVREDVALLKVDVEGFEPYVLHGARQLLSSYRVDNVVLEYSPGVPLRARKWEEVHRFPGMLAQLVDRGYQMVQLGDDFSRTLKPWEAPLPKMPAITADVLRHDMHDAVRMRKQVLGCPKPQELQHDSTFNMCMALPEDLHPKSFHSTFGHNTNVWATLNKELQQLNHTATVVPLDTPPDTWFIPEGQQYGMGGRRCADLLPKVQVRHRCRCSDTAVCGKLEQLVTSLAAKGKLRMANAARLARRPTSRTRAA